MESGTRCCAVGVTTHLIFALKRSIYRQCLDGWKYLLCTVVAALIVAAIALRPSMKRMTKEERDNLTDEMNVW